jgi:hypothetical protein
MTTKQKTRAAALGFAVAFLAQDSVSAQTGGTLDPQPLPALAKPDDPATPAKELFGRRQGLRCARVRRRSARPQRHAAHCAEHVQPNLGD